MSKDTDHLQVVLRRNDYDTSGEEFYLKVDKIDRNMSNNIVTRSIIATAGDIAGKKINLDTENYSMNGYIMGTEADTYPSYVSIDTDKWAQATEKEMNLAQAARLWGPDLSDGFDTLIWGPRTISGMISAYNVTENPGSKAPEQYDFTIQWTHTNTYIGD